MPRLAQMFGFAFAVAVVLASTSPPANCAEPIFEQVLVPFDTAVFPGQFGAVWSAELWVRNDGEQPVNLFPEKCFFIGREFPCSTRIDIPPRTTTLVDVIKPASAAMPGILLYVPRDRVADVQFSLRIRDLSQLAQSAGTEIPVVRQREYRTGRTNLLNVPLRPGFRPTLRVYSPDLGGYSQFIVRVYRDPGDNLLLEHTYTVSLPTDPPAPPLVPATYDFSSALAEVPVVGEDRVRVQVEQTFPREAPYWPLLTITNNATQQVTAITPR